MDETCFILFSNFEGKKFRSIFFIATLKKNMPINLDVIAVTNKPCKNLNKIINYAAM